jgi:hypothetical protein
MRIWSFILLIFSSIGLYGQADSVFTINLSDLEEIVENQELEDDLDMDNLVDNLFFLIENPLNLNTVTEEELINLNLLSEFQISSFIEYRNVYGDFMSIYELQAIPNWNILTIQRVLPFVDVKEKVFTSENIKNMVANGNHIIALKWKNVVQQRAGFDPESSPEYLGDPSHLYLRYRYNFNNKLRWGLTAEKDAGEPFFTKNNNSGFDYYSAFLHYYDPRSFIESFSIGDYTLSMGQGLISHNAFGSGKSTQAIDIKKDGKVIRPYSSVNEVNFFRGVSAQFRLSENFKIIPFISTKKVDGTVNLDTTFEDGFETFSSLIEDGYHRTSSEIDKKNSISQFSYGGVIKFRKNSLNIGLNYLTHQFDKPFDSSDQLYRKFILDGDYITNTSLDVSWRYRNATFFGEASRSQNGGRAFIIGNQTSLNRKVDIAIAYRDYGRDYQVLLPNAFGESINGVNEKGLYIGTSILINREFSIKGYFDSWKNPWLRFRTDAPSFGNESLIRVEYYKKRKYLFYVQYKNENKSLNITDDIAIRNVENTRIQRLRVHFNNKVKPGFELRNRIEFSRFTRSNTTSHGWMIYQDFIFKPQGSSISFTGRIALFDTDNFDTRIYAYENDILYEFRIPFFQQQGTRFYIHSRYKASRRLTLEGRFDRTYFNNIDEIGSSGEKILGNTRSEIKLQLVYKI